MTSSNFSALGSVLAPGLGNHLWQSTLFAVAAGLLTLILRKNHARARYWLWLAASIKFLIPYSALVILGGHLARPHSSEVTTAGLYVVIEQITRPFTHSALAGDSHLSAPIVSQTLTHLLPALLAAVWLCGFAVVILVWCTRWLHILGAIRDSVRLREGREIEALRRVERASGIPKRVEMLLSRTTLEPGIFGMAQPILLWPEGISAHLDDAHLEAVLAHELWHVRRRDNLAAALHMLVEAIFWFHPLVWWLGARLVDERERACDEQVLELGSQRHVYAESILKVCEFCVGSPLACVSGVTGADLKKRMVHIMSEHVVRKLDFTRKLLLTAAAFVAIAAPIVFGLVHATPIQARPQVEDTATAPAFESVSIKPSTLSTATNAGGSAHMIRMMHSPDGFMAANASLREVIQEAYGVQANQIVGGPDWLNSAAYDIEAKAGKPEADQPSFDQVAGAHRRMLQTLLADRFKLTLHRETKPLASFALVLAESGPKLQPVRGDEMMKGPDGRPVATRRMKLDLASAQVMGIEAQGTSVDEFAQLLSRQLGSAVVNKTGLTDSYDFNLHWASDPNRSSNETDANSVPSTSGPSLSAALQDQLGLKLEPQKAPMEILVIDHVEKPTEN
jgi:uncharacterized protein (TIGR03435 family)